MIKNNKKLLWQKHGSDLVNFFRGIILFNYFSEKVYVTVSAHLNLRMYELISLY